MMKLISGSRFLFSGVGTAMMTASVSIPGKIAGRLEGAILSTATCPTLRCADIALAGVERIYSLLIDVEAQNLHSGGQTAQR